MRTSNLLLLFSLTTILACSAPGDGSGGANANDRTGGGAQGELMLTGDMEVSPDGAFLIEQRTSVSVLVDVRAMTATELAVRGDRFVFSKKRHVVYEVLPNRAGVVALDLDHGMNVLWQVTPAFLTTSGAMLARGTDDDTALVLGDAGRLLVLDAQTGDVRGSVDVGSTPTDVAFLPDHARALAVGTVSWVAHAPSTDVVSFDLSSLVAQKITIPNCEAPIALAPDGSRAFVSPTYCQEGAATNPNGQWTNPDPVSVIDLDAKGPRFVVNLPGFGPVALDRAGTRAVAYLDTARMDPSMFKDPSQVPSKSGDQFHLMVIDPKTLAFALTPIGAALPRFAMSPDGTELLVDATVKAARGGGFASVTIGPGGLSAEAGVFGGDKSPFGVFDLGSRTFVPFSGAPAALDRFVWSADGSRVFTLKLTADGLGGELFALDVAHKTSTDLRKSLRDIGILPDGKTLVLRIRMPALTVGGQTFLQEDYCFSSDGLSCDVTIHYTSKTPVAECAAHDCTP